MKKATLILAGLLGAAAMFSGCASQQPATEANTAMAQEVKPLEQLQREFVEERFGMFLHFGILTYTGSWSQANLDIKKFNPTMLDCGQWADAAKDAGMTFGVLTTKHHDGFALWPTATSDFSVKSIPWKDGKGDVVKEYVDAFRSRGLKPGLYYSVWDNTKGIGNNAITEDDIKYVKEQLKELLTNYGPIPILVLDGYSWKMGHRSIPYADLREYIRSLQPNCLVVDHSHLQCLWDTDLAVFEEPRNVFAPKGNKVAAAQDQKIIGGNDWFWGDSSATESPMSLDDIVNKHLKPLEERYTVFILNCPPDRRGMLDDRIVRRLSEVGNAWKPNKKRKPLPPQQPQAEFTVFVKDATATSGNAFYAIDGRNDSYYYSVWESDKKFPQSITLDLGEIVPDVSVLCYVPKYVTVETPTNEGAVTSYNLYVSSDGQKFIRIKSGKWPANSDMKSIAFGPVPARYVRLEALAGNKGFAAATEITIGRAKR